MTQAQFGTPEASNILNFAPGETNIVERGFSPSVILFWLKTSIGVSSTRIMTRVPNTVLGLIPLGAEDATYPLANVAGVGVNTKFSVGRLVFGLVFLFLGFGLIGDTALLGLILLLLSISMLANTMSATLNISNNAGGVSSVQVSILEKAKLENFREEINQRLFADHDRLRHEEHMNVQNQQLHAQQQQLNAQIMQQQNYLNTQHQQPPQPPQA